MPWFLAFPRGRARRDTTGTRIYNRSFKTVGGDVLFVHIYQQLLAIPFSVLQIPRLNELHASL